MPPTMASTRAPLKTIRLSGSVRRIMSSIVAPLATWTR